MTITMVPVLLVLLSHVVCAISCPHTDHCAAPLGMQSGTIPDDQITASSYYRASTKASQSRAHTEQSNRAWCSGERMYTQSREFLEINLGSVHIITKVDIQRRSIIGHIKGYAEQYQLHFLQPGMDHWITYSDSQGKELLKGNSHKYMTQTSILNPPIIASRVRFVPYSNHHKIMCMRVELYGCCSTDGIVSYSMPDGDYWDKNHTLHDLTYDGLREGGWLSGGLGQLTDGKLGHNNFHTDTISQDTEGYNWVGWNNDTRHSQPVEITFEFDCIRNFSAVHIYTSNFTMDNEVFSRVRVLFSLDGEHYHMLPAVEYEHPVDCIFKNTHSVIIRLQNATAMYIKLQLCFAQRWILISEVSFESDPHWCDQTEVLQPEAAPPKTKMQIHDHSQGPCGNHTERLPPLTRPEARLDMLNHSTSMLVVGFMMMFIVYIGFPATLCICCCVAERRLKGLHNSNEADRGQPPPAPPPPPLPPPPPPPPPSQP